LNSSIALQFQGFVGKGAGGPMVGVYSSRNPWTPVAVSGRFLPRMPFASPTH
jgi:hypothetical protein